MPGLFTNSDFQCFELYGGLHLSEAPEGKSLLKKVYLKLGQITDALKTEGYHCKIIRNPLNQSQNYSEYHWAKIYPKDDTHFKECQDIVFFVIGVIKEGFEIHLDTNFRKGHICNETADRIKCDTWLRIPIAQASTMDLKQYVERIDNYITTNWNAFNQFAREFGIKTSIKQLSEMDLKTYLKLLKSNFNLILTGAPGTGKTFLAQKIASEMGATIENGQCEMVQFHPSYDYTDFVEGLRPISDEENDNHISFKRQNGIFKDFCLKAAQNLLNSTKAQKELKEDIAFDQAYDDLIAKIDNQELMELPLKSGDIFMSIDGISVNNSIILQTKGSDSNKRYIVSRTRLKKLSTAFRSAKELENLNNIHTSVTGVIKGCHSSAYWATLHYIYKHILKVDKSVTPTKIERKNFVFIIDEINRGEISKIFGELFYCIDPGYRGQDHSIKTQYQNLIESGDEFENGFYIPENVYIIGTMNDIDRSVDSMDFAMRRRFAWKEVSAESSQTILDSDESWPTNPKPSSEIINEIKARMANLNNAIIDKYDTENPENLPIGLSKAYQVGGAYFLKYALYNDFELLWEYHLKGLLYEYLRGTTDMEIKLEQLHKAYKDIRTH